jgi:hypothetical protein
VRFTWFLFGRSLDAFLCSENIIRLVTLATLDTASNEVMHALESCLHWSGMMLWADDSVSLDKLLSNGGDDMICTLISSLSRIPSTTDAKGIHFSISRFLFVVVSLRVGWICEVIGSGRHEQVRMRIGLII